MNQKFRVTRNPVPLPDDLAGDEQPFAPDHLRGPGPLIPGYGPGPGYNQPVQGNTRPRGKFIQIPFVVGTTAIQLLPVEENRSYLFILNFSGANQIFVGFDTLPTAVNGVTLAVSLGFYEPWVIPTNAIFVSAGGAGTSGMLIEVLGSQT